MSDRLPAAEIGSRISDASVVRIRAGVPEEATGYRLVHGEWDGLDGLIVDGLGDVAFVRYRDVAWAEPDAVDAVIEALRAAGMQSGVWVWDAPEKVRAAAPEAERDAAMKRVREAGFAAPREPVVITEGALRFEVDPYAGFSFGLFFDMRACRRDLAARWDERRVLNLFAYTCGFGVALGADNDVTNVDTSRSTLDWGARNYALNGLEIAPHTFVAKDAFAYLEVAVRVGNRFDAIVLDPPSFSAGKKGKARRFRLASDLPELATLALSALSPDGELFVSANTESIDAAAFADIVSHAAAETGRRIVDTWPPAGDFPVPPDRYHLKTALVARG